MASPRPSTWCGEALFDRALTAREFLSERVAGESHSVAERLDAGTMTRDEWEAHRSTFLPELRPRGYMELRAVDALPPRWYVVPLVFVTALLYDDSALEWTLRELPEPTEAALEVAGRTGLRDPRPASLARSAFRQALAGAERLGVDFTGAGPLDAAPEFFERFTQREGILLTDRRSDGAPGAPPVRAYASRAKVRTPSRPASITV